MGKTIEFNTWVYDEETDTEIDVLVEVVTYYAGCKATWDHPAEDAELEYYVYKEGDNVCCYKDLTPDQQHYLDERVWNYVQDYYTNYYEGDY